MEPTGTRSRASSSPSSSRATRRVAAGLTAGLGCAALLWLAPAGSAQQPPPPGTPTIIFEGGAQRFAVPACVPRAGDEASREACRTVTQVLRKDLDFEGIFRFVPEG